jgi:WD repeat-containing protein 19
MERIAAPKLHSAYAKAKEAGKEYAEAVKSYEKARDMDNVVRVLLDHLKQPERAAEVVRTTRSAEGARAVAAYCKGAGDTRGAVEFLLLAKRRDEAFELAATHDEMALYVQALRSALGLTGSGAGAGPNGSAGPSSASSSPSPASPPLPPEECLRVAVWYEGKASFARAAEMYGEVGQFQKALSLYLRCGEAELPRAIEVAGRAKSESVTHALIDHLMGETDGEPKDPKWVFKLYLSLGDVSQATKTALVIAEQEQTAGNYKVAHATLVEAYRAVEAVGGRVPRDLVGQLTLLHSYLLVKKLVKAENHEGAARMCVRVARAISKFPAHVVPILTSTVIECQRAGLKKTAFEYACVLMRPEHRESVEEKFRKKIEALVRRPSDEELAEEAPPCPFCSSPLPATDLVCASCKSDVPFCILTGRHMVAEDVAACPTCSFPASYPALAALAQSAEPVCPMCAGTVHSGSVQLIRDGVGFLRKAAGGAGSGDGEAAGEQK